MCRRPTGRLHVQSAGRIVSVPDSRGAHRAETRRERPAASGEGCEGAAALAARPAAQHRLACAGPWSAPHDRMTPIAAASRGHRGRRATSRSSTPASRPTADQRPRRATSGQPLRRAVRRAEGAAPRRAMQPGPKAQLSQRGLSKASSILRRCSRRRSRPAARPGT